MKRLSFLALTLLLATSAFAQEGLQSRVFVVQNQDPQGIAQSIQLLSSGKPYAGIEFNRDLHTVTVRDLPENLKNIEATIQRLDVPSPPQSDIELHLYVLVGSDTPGKSEAVPPELNDVVHELAATLRYSRWALMTSALHHTRPGEELDASGVAGSDLVSFEIPPSAPLIYSYTLKHIRVTSGTQPSVDVGTFRFSMKMPVTVSDKTQYSDVGFRSPVTIRPDEKVVVGTTAMGQRALVVVVTAKVTPPPSAGQS